MLLLLFLGVNKDPIPVRYGRDRSDSATQDRSIVVHRTRDNDLGFVVNESLDVVNVSPDARRAGARVGHRIVQVEGHAVSSKDDLSEILRKSSSQTLRLVVAVESETEHNLTTSVLETALSVAQVARPEVMGCVLRLLVRIRDDAVVRQQTEERIP